MPTEAKKIITRLHEVVNNISQTKNNTDLRVFKNLFTPKEGFVGLATLQNEFEEFRRGQLSFNTLFDL